MESVELNNFDPSSQTLYQPPHSSEALDSSKGEHTASDKLNPQVSDSVAVNGSSAPIPNTNGSVEKPELLRPSLSGNGVSKAMSGNDNNRMGTKRSFRAISVAASTMKACSKTRKLTSKILKEAFAQQMEIKNEKHAEEFPMSIVFNQAVDYGPGDDFIDDVDELTEFPNQFDYQDVTTEEEDKLLDALFNKDGASIVKRLSDAITTSTKEEELKNKEDDGTETNLMSKVIDFYQSLGKFMSVYTKGKMPKALTDLRSRECWDSLLMLTQPENWSPNAVYKITNMFASSGEKAGRFYELFLLPRVREDIRKHKKLHFCLYQSLKKSLFNPQGFFKGILIPLCKSGTCTVSEAIIIGSVMEKMSIPEKFSRDALVRLADMTFRGTTSYFIKVILDKKYALAYGAVDAVTAYFLKFHKEKTVMPVIWHQTLLAFVKCYKHELRLEDKKSLKSLLDKQHHESITPDIVRELDNSRNRGEKLCSSSSLTASKIIKPIKEDMFDMPQVPMEED